MGLMPKGIGTNTTSGLAETRMPEGRVVSRGYGASERQDSG